MHPTLVSTASRLYSIAMIASNWHLVFSSTRIRLSILYNIVVFRVEQLLRHITMSLLRTYAYSLLQYHSSIPFRLSILLVHRMQLNFVVQAQNLLTITIPPMPAPHCDARASSSIKFPQLQRLVIRACYHMLSIRKTCDCGHAALIIFNNSTECGA